MQLIVQKIFASLTNLRELDLFGCDLPTDSNQFAALAQLTKLDITVDYLTDDTVDVVGIIRQLINLEEFRVTKRWVNGFVLDEDMFSKIVNVVNGRPQELTLKCKFNFVPRNCDERRNVKLIRID